MNLKHDVRVWIELIWLNVGTGGVLVKSLL